MKTLDELMLLADAYADASKHLSTRLADTDVFHRRQLMHALEELIAESQREVQMAQEKSWKAGYKHGAWSDCEGVPV